MVVYPLVCAANHSFEGWYASPEAFDRQSRAGRLECPVCASSQVRKLPSAPHVHASGASSPVSAATREIRRIALQELKAFLLANTENVGRRFPEIARRIHYGEEMKRGIRGRVTLDEATELQEEGVTTFTVSPELQLEEDVH